MEKAVTSSDSRRPELVVRSEGDALLVALTGDYLTTTVHLVDQAFRDLGPHKGPLLVDLSGVDRFDTAGAWLIERLRRARAQSGHGMTVKGAGREEQVLLSVVGDQSVDRAALPRRNWYSITGMLEVVGRLAYGFKADFITSMAILGSAVRGAQLKAGKRNTVSLAPVVSQIDKMGLGAVPIVILMSTIIGAIIAQQGAFQLRYFGAELYVVDLVGILVLREIGVLVTAIMVAGRSGSAITAEIGSMKMREEVDALQVMGLNPVGVLVFPRLVALVIALPLLAMISNFSALVGAIFVSWTYSGISPDAFVVRLREAIDLTSVFSGLIKAPFMALIIGIIAAVEGLKVQGSAESLGLCVTRSVVKAIFVVIVVDGLFAMFFAAIDF